MSLQITILTGRKNLQNNIIPQNTDEKTRKEIWLSSKKTKFDKLVVQTIGLDAHKNGPEKATTNN